MKHIENVWNEIIFSETKNEWELVKTSTNKHGGKTFKYKNAESGETLVVYWGGGSTPWKLVFEK